VYDRHPMWVAAIGAVLERFGHEVVSATVDPDEAIAAIEQHRPSLFVLDPEEDEGALALLEAALAASPRLKVVAMASTNDRLLIERAFAAGAAAFVVKTATEVDIDAAVQLALTSAIHVSRHASSSTTTDATARALQSLTLRETEILRLVAAGLSNAAMSRRLWVTEQTVKFHLSNIYRKLQVPNRTAAAHWALTHGLAADDHSDDEVASGSGR